jgi:DNA polymerase-1
MSKLILIDGSAVAYRSHFAFIRNPLINSRGENTSAVYGFVNSLNKVINDFKPDYLAVVFDTPKPTFRHEIYSEYKSTRAETPNDLIEQFPWIDKAVDAFNIEIIRKDGYEADDLIGTLSKKAAQAGIDVLMFTVDKDFYQLVDEKVKILHPKDFSIMDSTAVEDKFGVPPDKVIDALALIGDTSDNVPGVPGIGPKTAISLIKEFGSFESILDEAPKKKKGKVAKSLEEFREQAELSKELVTIMLDSPIELDLEKLKIKEPDNSSLGELFRRLELTSFAKKYASKEADSLFDNAEAKVDANYKTVNSIAQLDEILSIAEKKGSCAIDTETTSLVSLNAKLVGISIATEEGEGYYIPVGHNRGENLPLDDVLSRFKKLFQSDVKIIGHNIKYDRQIFKNHAVFLEKPYFDTMIAAYLLNPGGRGYGLTNLALEHFNYNMMPISELIGEKKNQISFSEVNIEQATFYAAEDADFTLRLKNAYEPVIKKLELENLLSDIEIPLIPVLGDMEEAGVKIDTVFLSKLSDDYGNKINSIENQIYDEVGEEFNLNSPKQLSVVLFDRLNLKSTRKTAKGGARSTSVDVLEKLAETHPVPRMMLEYRQFAKLKSTYIDALPELINSSTGRVHSSFNQTVAATGRL